MRATVLVLLPLLLVACSEKDAAAPAPGASRTPITEVTATPSATAAPIGGMATSDPTPTPRTTEEQLQQVIDAVATGDVHTLLGLVEYQEVPCDGQKEAAGLPFPDCASEPLATPVEAFPAGVCSLVWHRDPRAILERFVERAGELVAVINRPQWAPEDNFIGEAQAPAGDYRVIFLAEPAATPVGYVAVIQDGRLASLVLGCMSPADSLLHWQDEPPEVVRRGSAFVAPPSRPAQPAPPTPGREPPRGDRTGDTGIDVVLDAMESADVQRIRSVLLATPKQCSYASSIGGPPPCEAGEMEGTVVNAFHVTGCEGAWARADLDAHAQRIADFDVSLYAVTEPRQSGGAWDGWRSLIYQANGDEEPSVDLALWYTDGGVPGYVTLGCTSAEVWADSHDVILRGPAWDAAAP